MFDKFKVVNSGGVFCLDACATMYTASTGNTPEICTITSGDEKIIELIFDKPTDACTNGGTENTNGAQEITWMVTQDPPGG